MSYLPLFLHRRVFSFPLKLSSSAVCLWSTKAYSWRESRASGGAEESEATPCPSSHTKTDSKAVQLVLAETFFTKQSGTKEIRCAANLVVATWTFGFLTFCVDLISTFFGAVIYPQHMIRLMNIDLLKLTTASPLVHKTRMLTANSVPQRETNGWDELGGAAGNHRFTSLMSRGLCWK